jgi:hypothetical protein
MRTTLRVLPILWLLAGSIFCVNSVAIADENGPAPLQIGASAPDFCLPGIDEETHCLKDYAGSKVLVIAFTCNHCPTAQLYETRIKQLADDYRDRSVALVAIQPNSPKSVRLDEMGYTDVGDSFEFALRSENSISLISMTVKPRRLPRPMVRLRLRTYLSSMRNENYVIRDALTTILVSR